MAEFYWRIFASTIFGRTSLKIYFGDPVKFIGDIPRSYEQACLCLRYGKILYPAASLILYSHVSCLAILETCDIDTSMLERMEKRITSFNACDTLEAVLEYKAIKQAANAVYIHENTMRYRIGKIQQILNVDIYEPHIALDLLLKLKIYKLRKSGENPTV